jgi:hypothetical protein
MTRVTNLNVFRSLSEPLLATPRVVCAYCSREIAPGDPHGPVSHGCCKSCEASILREER